MRPRKESAVDDWRIGVFLNHSDPLKSAADSNELNDLIGTGIVGLKADRHASGGIRIHSRIEEGGICSPVGSWWRTGSDHIPND